MTITAIHAVATKTLYLPDGSASAPVLQIGSSSSGLYRKPDGSIGLSVNGVEQLALASTGLVAPGNITTLTTLHGDGGFMSNVSFYGTQTTLANVQITDSSFKALDDTAVANGGYILVNGNGFAGGSVVSVGGVPASSSMVLSYTQLGAQVPAMPNGTYDVSVTGPDGVNRTLPLGVTYAPFPVWSTGSTLANVAKYTTFSQTLSATDAVSNVTYTVDSGSSLPPGVTLSSNGTLSGNITNDSTNITIYSFIVQATDIQYQNVPRTFSLIALPYIRIPQNGLVMYLDANYGASWPGTGTTWYDLSGNNRNGTWSAATLGTTASGKQYFGSGTGYYLTGQASNSYGITDLSGYTIFISFYVSGTGQNDVFLFYGNGTRGIFSHLPYSTSTVIYFDQGGCCNSDTRTQWDAGAGIRNAWHTVAYVRTAGSTNYRYIYYDGVSVVTNTTNAASLGLTTQIANLLNQSNDYAGAFSSMAIWNRDLSPSEIAAVHSTLVIT